MLKGGRRVSGRSPAVPTRVKNALNKLAQAGVRPVGGFEPSRRDDVSLLAFMRWTTHKQGTSLRGIKSKENKRNVVASLRYPDLFVVNPRLSRLIFLFIRYAYTF